MHCLLCHSRACRLRVQSHCRRAIYNYQQPSCTRLSHTGCLAEWVASRTPAIPHRARTNNEKYSHAPVIGVSVAWHQAVSQTMGALKDIAVLPWRHRANYSRRASLLKTQNRATVHTIARCARSMSSAVTAGMLATTSQDVATAANIAACAREQGYSEACAVMRAPHAAASRAQVHARRPR